MSTSDFRQAGLPTVEELAALANQLFKALPGSAAGGAPMSPPSSPGSPGSPSVAGASGVTGLTGALPPVVQPYAAVPMDLNSLDVYAPKLPLAFPVAQFAQPAARAAQGAAESLYFLQAAPQPSVGGMPGMSVPGAISTPVAALANPSAAPFDVNLIRRDFPILSERVQGRQLVWLDNAATTQKPQAVIDRLQYFYEHENSNIHRAAHELAARATDAYEAARDKVRGFLNAASSNEIVFVRGATEAINLVAQTWGRQNIGKDDEIIISWLEHHANIVPWHQLAAEKGARLRVIPVDDDGQVLIDEFAKLLGPRTKLVSFTQVSNALGTVTPAKTLIDLAHSAGARVLVDGAQAVSHMPVDVRTLDSDWYVFSGHKVFGPTGIGVLHGKESLLNEMPPWQGGGNMITDVTLERSLYQSAPLRFEAGTGNIADAVGLGAAIDYVSRIGMSAICAYEQQLLAYATRALLDINGLKLIGTAHDKAGVLSFVLDGYKTEDVGAALSHEGIAVRAGHHCAQPILRRFGLESTVRPSLAFYNTTGDIDALVGALRRLTGGSSPRPVVPGFGDFNLGLVPPGAAGAAATPGTRIPR